MGTIQCIGGEVNGWVGGHNAAQWGRYTWLVSTMVQFVNSASALKLYISWMCSNFWRARAVYLSPETTGGSVRDVVGWPVYWMVRVPLKA